MHETSGRHRNRRRRRARLSPLTVFGELLLIGGLGVLGYLVWQPWYTSVVVQGEQQRLAASDSEQWRAEPKEPYDGEIPVVERPDDGEVFGVLHVPAFGKTFSNRIAYTADQYLLDSGDYGIGQYEQTQMPGEAGNFAIAAHRNGPIIAPFREVMNLRIGEPLFVETAEGWYTYRFRDLEYVWPDESEVVNPFPRLEGTPGDDQILTLTTCHPKWAGSEERAIAYAVFEDYQPLSDGPPDELVELNPDVEGA